MSAVTQTAVPTDGVNIEIDGVALQAPKGSMIIHAADKAGIAIPRFCYHDKLPIAANCRMCLVDVEKAPKPMPACATPVMEGMRVFTQSKRALDSQRNVMEFLLINHPLDCPICDQGGECELQDVAMGYGRSVSRFSERKRVQADENLGPLVATDMTRCIHCTRCVRFSTEIAGTFELGGMGRGENLSIGTYIGKTIESELSGNLIDVCPVGALTNKPFRFRARAWELTAKEGVGYHDALGSNLFMHLRRGEIMRCVPRDNESINESWLSDRDRYSHAGLKSEDRLTAPMVRENGEWREVSWEVALERASQMLRATPAEQLGFWMHPSSSNEEGQLLARLAAGLGCGNLDHRLQVVDFADDPRAEAFAANLDEIEHADQLLLIGLHARWEAPILGHRLRKAWKAGGKIHSLDAVAHNHNLELSHQLLRDPSRMIDALLGLARVVGEGRQQTPPAGLAAALAATTVDDEVRRVGEQLLNAQRPVLLLGEVALNHIQGSWIRQLAAYLAHCLGGRLNQLWSGANALGLVQSGVLPKGRHLRAMVEQPLSTVVLHGVDPQLDLALGGAALRALAGAKDVLAFTAYASPSLRDVASVMLPIGLLPEAGGTLTNAQGQTQRMTAAAKLPGQSRPSWRVLRALGERLGLAGFDFLEFESVAPAAIAERGAAATLAPREVAETNRLYRLATTPIYAADAVLRRAAPLQSHPLARPAEVVMNGEDAAAMGVADGDVLRVDDGHGTASLPLQTRAEVARGTIWIESALAATAGLAATGAALTVTKA